MTDTTKFASPVNAVSPVNDVKLNEATTHEATLRDDAHQTIEQVGDSVRSRPGRWGTAGAGLLAAAAAVGVLVWRRRTPRTPREKAVRAWHDLTARFGR